MKDRLSLSNIYTFFTKRERTHSPLFSLNVFQTKKYLSLFFVYYVNVLSVLLPGEGQY